MDRAFINKICARLPGAECSDPWGGGHDAWKVGGKLFLTIGASLPGFSIKTESIENAQILIEAGHASRAPYFHKSWVHVGYDQMPQDEAMARIEKSYWIIRGGLPKKVQRALGEPSPKD
ncbi:MAG: MmcQ/YjbR family DNA-binding protein [Parvularcula sp.]